MVSGVGVDVLAEFVYDGDGGRLQQLDATGSTTTTITYTNDIMGLSQVLVSDDGTTTTYNLFGLDLISQDDGTETRFMLTDGLGSVRTEMVGNTIQTTTTYEPYGRLLAQTGSSGTVYGFTGEQYDALTGLVYLRARYYNPYLNQLQSRDPFPGYAMPSISQNGYAYVHANPINSTDPSGLDPYWCDSRPEPARTQCWQDWASTNASNSAQQPPSGQLHNNLPSIPPPNIWSSPYEYYVAQKYDPMFNNPWFYDPNYADYPYLSSNYSMWRSAATGCYKCHVTHWTGRIPTNDQLCPYMIDFWHQGDKVKTIVILTSMSVLAQQAILADEIITAGREIQIIDGAKSFPNGQPNRLPQDANVNPQPPPASRLTGRTIGGSPAQNAQVQSDAMAASRMGARDIRINQQQVNASNIRVGINRPDLQYTLNGTRYYIEYERAFLGGRGLAHEWRILANDPAGVVITKIIP